MANYVSLKNAIQSVIKANGNNEITGPVLQSQLLAMINTLGAGYQYMGVAQPSTNPGTPDARVMYLAYLPGTYVNFNGISVDGFCVLKYDASWTKEEIPISESGDVGFLTEPDDLDLETIGESKVLKFANREYNTTTPDGYGYKILRKDSAITAQITEAKTVYSIRYDFSLSGGNVDITFELPADVILRFDGGSIKNGTLVGNRTVIEAEDYQIFDGVKLSGAFVGNLNAVWVGAKPNMSNYDNGAILDDWFKYHSDGFKKIVFPCGTYYFLSGASLNTDKRDLVLDGDNSLFYVNIPTDDDYFIKLQTGGSSSGEGFRIENCRIKNTKKTNGLDISKTRAILLDGTQRFEIQNTQIWYFDVAVEIVNVWYGGFTGQNAFRYNRIGLLIRAARGQVEVNTLESLNVDFHGVSRETVAAIYPKNDGESDADYLNRTASCGVDAYCLLQGVAMRGCVFEAFDYGIRTNWVSRESIASQKGGIFTIDGCYFEANRTDDIYIGKGNYSMYGSGSSYYCFSHQMTISNCRFWTLRHVTLSGAEAFISSCQDFNLTVDSPYPLTTMVDYQGPVTIDGLIGGTAIVHKIGGRPDAVPTSTGSSSTPGTNFQKLQQTRFYGSVISRQDGYSKVSTSSNPDNVCYKTWNFETEPQTRFAFDILPLIYYTDPDNSFSKILAPSGNGIIPVNAAETYNFRALNSYGDISLYEFLRRWKAGLTYTGTVKNLFPFKVTADPVAGTVVNESGALVGFGNAALGTTITVAYTAGYYLYVDALVWVRISYSRIKQFCDHLQNGRAYSELRGSMADNATVSAYLSCFGTNAQMASVQKRLNAVYFDSTNRKLMIYTGFAWVEMTSAFQRYYYKEHGVKLSERATMADLPGQTFTNFATGIKYTFIFRPNNSYKWVPSIGMVDDLAHPNGYSDDNTLDYANELSVGEMVMYNGALYKWDGSALVAM